MPYRSLASMERHYPTSRYAVVSRHLGESPTYYPCHNFQSALTLSEGQDAQILEAIGDHWVQIHQTRA